MSTGKVGSIILASVLVASTSVLAQAEIDLRIDPDDGDGYYRLYWTGGTAPYEIYRSTDPAIVVLATNRLGETILQVWIDEPPVDGGPYFYQVTSSCAPACDTGEICCHELCCSLPNATPGCGGAGLGCVVESCDENFWNRNGINSDGCEFFCDTPGLSDFPDLLGEDENCDLVDGEVDNAVFVAKWGDDGNDGSLDYPKLTVQAGLDAAVGYVKRDVYVAAGLYEEQVSIPAGIGLYGGYDSDFHRREVDLYETIISGAGSSPALPGAVNFLSVNGQPAGSTVLDGFTVFAPDSQLAGWSSYGVFLSDSDESVNIVHNRIYGGSGGDGADGANGTDGASGTSGSPGIDALDLYVAHGVANHDCTSANHSQGGSGGLSDCGDTPTDGGDGGERVCPAWDGERTIAPVASENGLAGLNGGGPGGEAGWDVYHQAFSCDGYNNYGRLQGEDGGDGSAGGDGAAGQGCTDTSGTVVGTLWVAGSSTAGSAGMHGSGGGGGGSGAGAWMHSSCNAKGFGWDNLGGSGGGGGSGGCAGTGGSAGEGGGGSFAVFVTWTTPPPTVPGISDNSIYTGYGGGGGDGGHAGLGGAAGGGGSGGIAEATYNPPDPVYPSFDGGDGGNGGEGGQGGGGGGACGGPAYGIFAHNIGTIDLQPWRNDNLFIPSGSGGAGGRGGMSYGNQGTDGSDGAHTETNF